MWLSNKDGENGNMKTRNMKKNITIPKEVIWLKICGQVKMEKGIELLDNVLWK